MSFIFVPDRHLDHVRRCTWVASRYVDLLRLRRDLVNRAHEQVGDYGDAQETVQTLMIRIYHLVQGFERS